MIEPSAALAAAKQIDDAVGLIARLLGKLRAQPDIAALKLSAALYEIQKSYNVLNEAFAEFNSLALVDGALTDRSQRLLDIASGSLGVQVKAGLGSCHQIGNIYQKHLRRWFEKAFKHREQTQVQAIFDNLSNADRDLFRVLAKLADDLADDAKEVVGLVMQGKYDEAQQRVLISYEKLLPVQKTMARTAEKMFDLNSSFIQIAHVT